MSLEALTKSAGRRHSMEFASAQPTPFDFTHMREETERVSAALIHLEVAQREVVMLRFQEDMSLDEIATITGAPLSTVKSRLYRGLEALKPVLTAMKDLTGASA